MFLLRRKKYWQSVNLAKTKIVVNIDIFLKEVQQQPTSLISRVLNQANNVVAVSKDVYNDLSKRIKINSPPLLLINNWTTVSRKDHLPEKNSKNVEFIFAGRLAKQKQPWLLIEFMKKVTKINSQAILEIYGSGPLRENLKKQIGQAELKKNIILKNPVKNIEKKLAKAKYLLLFSKFEGLPFIALESMKQGGVLLVLDNPGLRDIVVDEKTGIKKKNIQEVFLAWKKLENNTKRYALLQKEAFNLVNKKFNHKNLEQYITLLQ